MDKIAPRGLPKKLYKILLFPSFYATISGMNRLLNIIGGGGRGAAPGPGGGGPSAPGGRPHP
ncbi:MAG: hypothetical protein LBU16_07230, partial [Treponema sp.]|nr:hypothetical protein [Treponema sp.]